MYPYLHSGGGGGSDAVSIWTSADGPEGLAALYSDGAGTFCPPPRAPATAAGKGNNGKPAGGKPARLHLTTPAAPSAEALVGVMAAGAQFPTPAERASAAAAAPAGRRRKGAVVAVPTPMPGIEPRSEKEAAVEEAAVVAIVVEHFRRARRGRENRELRAATVASARRRGAIRKLAGKRGRKIALK